MTYDVWSVDTSATDSVWVFLEAEDDGRKFYATLDNGHFAWNEYDGYDTLHALMMVPRVV